MTLLSLPMLYSVLSPETRSVLADVALILGFVIAFAGAVTILLKWFGKYFWAPFRWMLARVWRRDEHGIRVTPSVRLERWLNGVMEPAITANTETLLAEMVRTGQDAKLEMGRFRRENALQHTAVEVRLQALETSQHGLSERLVAVETALKLTTERTS